MAYKDHEKKLEAGRRYRAKHKKELSEKGRIYRASEKGKENMARWRATHPDTHHYEARYREKHRERVNEFARNWARKNRKPKFEFINDLKKKMKCEICGLDDPDCLVFHHKNPDEKSYDIGYMLSGTFSTEKVMEEIAKCSVLCANCHMKLHANKRGLDYDRRT